MAFKFNPTTGKLDTVADPAGSDTQIQFNDSGEFGGDADLTWNKTTNVLTNKGDISLDDGGSFTTTLQVVTPTANRTISLPNATGTVGLVSGSSGQVIYNNAGAYAGVSTMTFDGTNVTLAGRLINSYTSVASSPAKVFTGTWFTGGSATTTKPHFLIEPTGSTSTAWNTNGTGLGVNASSVTFAGLLIDLQANASTRFNVSGLGRTTIGTTAASGTSITTTAPAWFFSGAGTYTDTAAAGTTTHGAIVAIDNPAIAGTNARTYTNASTVYIDGAPTASTNITITNGYSFFVNAGTSYFGGNLQIADTVNVVLATGTGTKIGTATTQKLGFYNATPVVQPTAVGDITTTATTGTLPTAHGTVTIADAAAPTNAELLEYCVELEVKLEAALSRFRDLGLIAT